MLPESYTTIKFVSIHSRGLAVTRILVQAIIMLYIVVYTLYLKGGYQQVYTFTGEVDIKLKGVAKTDVSGSSQVYDSYDLVQPALQNGATFVTTNFLRTLNQSRSVCPGNDLDGGAPAERSEVCNSTTNSCPSDIFTLNGVTTGGCGMNQELQKSMCLLDAWCPVEPSTQVLHELPRVGNFTAFIRVDGHFSGLGNEYDMTTASGSAPTWFKNLFYISDMVALASDSSLKMPAEQSVDEDLTSRLPFEPFSKAVKKGTLLVMFVTFDCNLDNSIELCEPTIEFRRLDDPDSFSSGYNYRYVNYYYWPAAGSSAWTATDQRRDLYKVYGTRIVASVSGDGRKFSPAVAGTTVGAGLGLLSLATVLVDFLMQYFHPQRKKFHNAKFQPEEVADFESLVSNKRTFSEAVRGVLAKQGGQSTSNWGSVAAAARNAPGDYHQVAGGQ